MSWTKLAPPKGRILWFPVGASGSNKTLPRQLDAGFYRIITDTTQSLTVAQFTVNSASTATTFGVAIRGGVGSVTITEACDKFTITTGTFPLFVGFERLD